MERLGLLAPPIIKEADDGSNEQRSERTTGDHLQKNFCFSGATKDFTDYRDRFVVSSGSACPPRPGWELHGNWSWAEERPDVFAALLGEKYRCWCWKVSGDASEACIFKRYTRRQAHLWHGEIKNDVGTSNLKWICWINSGNNLNIEIDKQLILKCSHKNLNTMPKLSCRNMKIIYYYSVLTQFCLRHHSISTVNATRKQFFSSFALLK